jgi:primosomal protein N' (replication factor Y)
MGESNTAASLEAEAGYAAVAVPVPVRRLFTYEVRGDLAAAIEVGARVRVPFGNRALNGTVVEWPAPAPGPEVVAKPIDAVLSGAPRLSSEVLELTRFVSDYYLSSWGEAIEAATPPPAQPRARRAVRRLPAADPSRLPTGATARRRLLEALPPDGGSVPLDRLGASERRAVRPLGRLGWIELVDEAWNPIGERRERPAADAEPPPQPTPAQAQVLEQLAPALEGRDFAPFLLFGATGSGKTEVYLRAAQRVLEGGRSVLYLVPEIGLTPLLRSKISRRFPGQTAVLHSALPRRARYEAWELVRRGRCRLVVGTRSAVFAPLDDIGLIVVDEEQDPSYKQGESPRYNGRDVAVVRARAAGAVVLLGSATPSMESFRHARSGRYRLLSLGGSVEERQLPEVGIVDMRREYRAKHVTAPLSSRLIEELRGCLGRGDQALILRNRRGWAAALLCASCGERVCCSRCSISLTWHRAQRRLRCHYCNAEEPYPDQCPSCGADELRQLGEGTERVEDELRRALPGARIERMDRDTTRRRGAQEALLRRFDRGEVDVLIGTQMIAKGHDFPRVTLVGVLSADQTLGLPDFRAGERTFQLLTQVAGRAGRGSRPGRVVIQAFDPEHPVLGLAATQDYEAFYEREIRYRRALRYPPVSALVRLVVHDADEGRVQQWADSVAEALRAESGGRLLVSGPGPAPVERVKGRHRQHVLVRSAGRRRLVDSVDRALAALEGVVPRRAIQVDVDPLSVL